jgi:hypothetical protein
MLAVLGGFDGGVSAQSVPIAVMGLTLADSIQPDGEGGVRFRYEDAAGHSALVDLYEVAEERLEVSDSIQLELEVATYVERLPAAAGTGESGNYEVPVRSQIEVSTPEGKRPGRVVVAVLSKREEVVVSFMHLFTVGNRYLRVRLALPFAEWRESRLPNFAIELAKEVFASDSAIAGQADASISQLVRELGAESGAGGAAR